MKTASIVAVVLLATMFGIQSGPDETGGREIIHEQTAAWNKGDAEAYSWRFAADGIFTNLLGMYFTGRDAFRERHAQIFKTDYRGSVKQEEIVSVKFVRPEVAIV
jgi:uncharacterized protein (TIGR02246 family)